MVIHHDHPEELVGARHQCPLLVGVGNGEMFLASMAAAFLDETRSIQLIEDGEVVSITPEGVALRLASSDGELEREVVEVDWDIEAAEKSGYETFMLKEIYEQPEAVARDARRPRPPRRARARGASGMTEDELQNLRRIVIVACGTCLPRGRRRPLHDRGVGARPGRARHRERVDLPQPGARRRTRS